MNIQPMTLAQAKRILKANVDEGTHCLCCGKWNKVYRRKLNSGQARSLIAMYQISRDEFIHLPSSISARSREEAKMTWWGLVEEENVVRDDGGRAGYWRLTNLGRSFVRCTVRVPSHAVEYQGVLLYMDTTEQVDIREVLGKDFNYEELMRGE